MTGIRRDSDGRRILAVIMTAPVGEDVIFFWAITPPILAYGAVKAIDRKTTPIAAAAAAAAAPMNT